MTHLGEYIAEAVARGRGRSRKYDLPEDNWKSIADWLGRHGFEMNRVTTIKNFNKKAMCYNVGAEMPDGTPYYISVHVRELVFDIHFNTTPKDRGKVNWIKMTEKGSGQNGILVGFDYFIEKLRDNE